MMKKILSLILAIAMLSVGFVSVVGATPMASLDDSDGESLFIAGDVPTEAYYATVTPTVKIDATQLKTYDDVKAATSKKVADANPVADNDVYKIDIQLTNLGEVLNGYTEDEDHVYAGIYDITVGFPGIPVPVDPGDEDTLKDTYIKSGQIQGGTAKIGLKETTLNIAWTASGVNWPYPKCAEQEETPYVSAYYENASVTLTGVIFLKPGTALNLSGIETKITYCNSETGVNYKNTKAALQTLAIGSAAPDVTKIETAETKTNFGTATTDLKDRAGEDVTLTKNYGITKFSPTLNTATKKYFINAKDTSGNEMGKTAINFAAQRIEGKATFYVIVKSAEHVISDIWIEEEDAE